MLSKMFKKQAVFMQFIALSIVAFSVLAIAGGKYKLVYKGEKGQVLHYNRSLTPIAGFSEPADCFL
jgi:hypothetical protein